MMAYLVRGLWLGGTAASQPGPFQAYLLSQTLTVGWRRTLLAAFAPLLSDGPIVILVLVVLTQVPSGFLLLLQMLGGLFLLYLAGKAAAKLRRDGMDVQLALDPGRQNLWQAALVNALNPSPYLFWTTIGGPIFITGWRQSPSVGMSFIAGFYVTLIGGFIGFIALFAVAGRLDPKVSRILRAVSVVALSLFGLFQLWSGVTAWAELS